MENWGEKPWGQTPGKKPLNLERKTGEENQNFEIRVA